MATFVLSHGAWGGGWEWKQVAGALVSRRHTVYRHSLTGLGERVHLARPDVGLGTHIGDIVSLFASEEIHNAILCGHSYSGMVITGAAPKLSGRIRRLVYIDGFLPEPNESMFDLTPEPLVEVMKQLMETDGEGWRIPLPFPVPGEGEAPPEVVEYLSKASTPMPAECFTQTLDLPAPGLQIPATYIKCTQIDGVDFLGPSAQRARDRGWPVLPLDAPHDAQFFAPEALAALLHEIAVESQARQ